MIGRIVALLQLAECHGASTSLVNAAKGGDAADMAALAYRAAEGGHELVEADLVIAVLIKILKQLIELGLGELVPVVLHGPDELMAVEVVVLVFISTPEGSCQILEAPLPSLLERSPDPGDHLLWWGLLELECWVDVRIGPCPHQREYT